MEVPKRSDLRKLKVVELRQRLSKLSQPQGGVKEDLITRLINIYEKKRDEEKEAESEENNGEEEAEREEMVVSIGMNKDTDLGVAQEPEAAPTSVETPPIQTLVQEPEATPISEEAPPKQELVQEPEATPISDEALPSQELTKEPEAIPTNEEATPIQAVQEPEMEPPVLESKTPPAPDPEEGDTPSDEVAPPIQTEDPPSGVMTPLTEPPAPPLDIGVAPGHEEMEAIQEPETLPRELALPTQQEAEVMITEEEAAPTQMQQKPMHTDSDETTPITTEQAAPTHDPQIPYHDKDVPLMDTPPNEPVLIAEPIPASTATSLPQQVSLSGPPSLMGLNFPKHISVATSEVKPVVFSSDYFSASDNGTVSREERSDQTSSRKEERGGKRKKKKKRKRRRHDQPPVKTLPQETAKGEPDVEIEYIQEDILKSSDPNYRQFRKIFESFRISEEEPVSADPASMSVSELVAQAAEKSKQMSLQQKQDSSSDEEAEKERNEEEQQKISKKKLRKLNRLSVAQLKQLVERPDVVEMHDVTATDPKLLIHLKSSRNTVPVPRHWCFKRKYLQGKRGIEKPPFDLPDFIKATGVMEMRQALEDKEDSKSLKQKTRERVRPKMGKLTIDYQKLHDAFFKWQTKPKMTIHGDMYYEGKEFETRLRQKKPGDLSDELRRALGMPIGMGKQKFPPPWLVAMQRYGPPPSYPNLKIPGLNAAIPENCSFGYFVGGWGKPPVDETGRPLYGDVFGLEQHESGQVIQEEEEVDRTFWGELESEEEEEEEEDEESDKADSPKPEDLAAGLVTPMEGLVTPSGLTSIPAGLETPDMIQLRKKKIEEAMEQGGETPALYTVISEKATSVGGAMMGSSHVYDLAAAASGAASGATIGGGATPAKKSNAVEVALDPSELDLDTATIAARYEEQVREKRNSIQKEDLSDMVAEHAAKQKKRKRTGADSVPGGKAAKKLKEFKF